MPTKLSPRLSSGVVFWYLTWKPSAPPRTQIDFVDINRLVLIQHHQMNCFLNFIAQTNKIRAGFFAKINVAEEIVAEFHQLKSQMAMLAAWSWRTKSK